MDKERKLKDIWKKVTSFEEVYKDSSIKKMLGDKYGSDYKTMVNYLTEIGKTDGYLTGNLHTLIYIHQLRKEGVNIEREGYFFDWYPIYAYNNRWSN